MPSILLIDDDPYLLMGLKAEFQRVGFAVYGAQDGLHGIEAAKRILPDLIICDVLMPLLNGLQLKERINHDPILAKIPLIFVSGRDTQPEIDYAMSLGAEGYVIKPVKFDHLLGRVNSILKLHRKRDE